MPHENCHFESLSKAEGHDCPEGMTRCISTARMSREQDEQWNTCNYEEDKKQQEQMLRLKKLKMKKIETKLCQRTGEGKEQQQQQTDWGKEEVEEEQREMEDLCCN